MNLNFPTIRERCFSQFDYRDTCVGTKKGKLNEIGIYLCGRGTFSGDCREANVDVFFFSLPGNCYHVRFNLYTNHDLYYIILFISIFLVDEEFCEI